MAKAGKGRRTRQYNSGAKSLGAYVAAASKHRRGTWDAGGKVIHDTPKSKRSEFAREIWALRRQLGTDRFSDFDWETGEKVKRNAKRRKKNPGLLSGALAGAAMGAAKALINPKKKTVRKKRASKNSYRTLPRMIVGEAYKLLRGRGVKITPELKAQVDRGMARGKSASQIANELSRSLKRKRNDGSEAEAAAQAYEDFHGRSASKVLAMQEALMTAGDYWAIGDDPELWLQPNVWKNADEVNPPDIWFAKDDKVKLAGDPEGHQLYFVGGNQKLPLEYLKQQGLVTDKRFITLGEVFGISYRTEKSFDAFKTKPYAHEFGEETGERPWLIYDQHTERLILVGGAYSIAPVDRSLGASPGIVN